MSSFKERIKELRNQYEMTQKEFSDFLGIRQQTLSGYERGTSTPSLEIAINISDKCLVSLDWLSGKSNVDSSTHERFTTYGVVASLIVDIVNAIGLNSSGIKTRYGLDYKFYTESKTINKFIDQLIRMQRLEASNVITHEIYNSWLNGEISRLWYLRLDDEQFRELDKYIPGHPGAEDDE